MATAPSVSDSSGKAGPVQTPELPKGTPGEFTRQEKAALEYQYEGFGFNTTIGDLRENGKLSATRLPKDTHMFLIYNEGKGEIGLAAFFETYKDEVFRISINCQPAEIQLRGGVSRILGPLESRFGKPTSTVKIPNDDGEKMTWDFDRVDRRLVVTVTPRFINIDMTNVAAEAKIPIGIRTKIP
jgi:hypothetical protein